MARGSGGMTREDVKSCCDSLEVSPSGKNKAYKTNKGTAKPSGKSGASGKESALRGNIKGN